AYHLGEHGERAHPVIELATAVIRDVHAFHAVVAGDGGVFGGGDALEDEGNIVGVLEALDLIPGEGGLPVHAGGGLTPRLDEALVDVALAPAVVGRVHRHAEDGVAVVARALDVIVHEGVVAAHVELENAVVVRSLGGGLEAGVTGARQHMRHPEGSRALGRGGAAARGEALHGAHGSAHHGETH